MLFTSPRYIFDINEGDWIEINNGRIKGVVNATGYSDNDDFDVQYHISFWCEDAKSDYIIFESDYRVVSKWVEYEPILTSHVDLLCEM